ncbi:hypothetical protein SADUNF_Sadunf10G0142400 [Salix dunnii]|uniref:Uncharacterized protein n=1 Tax=Salix dunnii TaxID=1413687 RepID=A0A835MV47_9ROSI|nr:hypothetical protein SADUNF_Sadunf10G0142400 [Salix dunnii]
MPPHGPSTVVAKTVGTMAPLTLIEACGDRQLNLNRGEVRQKDWEKVADTVTNHQNGVKPRKIDVQCKTDDMAWFEERLKKKRHRMEGACLSDGAACSELAKAILKIGEIPERIESSEQQAANDGVGETEDGVH